MNAYSFVGRYVGVSSLLLMISLHLSNVWKTVKVSPMLYKVARFLARSFLVGGPGALLISPVSCSTSFFCFSFTSTYNPRIKQLPNREQQVHLFFKALGGNPVNLSVQVLYKVSLMVQI